MDSKNLPGVYESKRKNGSTYYRASVTHKNKHISLGSYETKEEASNAYLKASSLFGSGVEISDYDNVKTSLPFDKWVSIINFRDNEVYFCTPIYLRSNYFQYYISPSYVLTFDVEDLFYYASHRIQKRGGRLFVADYGMQITLNSRYGIRPYGKCGLDHFFVNGDVNDYRYSNISIISRYCGVYPRYLKSDAETGRIISYDVRLHINGNYKVGSFKDEVTAAIAYNKAVDIAKSMGIQKKYGQNFIEEMPAKEYASLYLELDLSEFEEKIKTHS